MRHGVRLTVMTSICALGVLAALRQNEPASPVLGGCALPGAARPAPIVTESGALREAVPGTTYELELERGHDSARPRALVRRDGEVVISLEGHHWSVLRTWLSDAAASRRDDAPAAYALLYDWDGSAAGGGACYLVALTEEAATVLDRIAAQGGVELVDSDDTQNHILRVDEALFWYFDGLSKRDSSPQASLMVVPTPYGYRLALDRMKRQRPTATATQAVVIGAAGGPSGQMIDPDLLDLVVAFVYAGAAHEGWQILDQAYAEVPGAAQRVRCAILACVRGSRYGQELLLWNGEAP